MNPPSPRTTPRRLIVPISRHFLPVLQPEPLAWLTTGLINGSRRPFALYFASGTTGCSLPSLYESLAALPVVAETPIGGVLFETGVKTPTDGPCFAVCAR